MQMFHARNVANPLVATMFAAVFAVGAATSWAGALDATSVLQHADLSSDEVSEVMAGQFVTSDLKTVSDRDLSLLIVFLVETSTTVLADQVWAGVGTQVDPNMIASGEIAQGTLADFDKLTLGPDPAAMTELYGGAAPGSDLNLSSDEIGVFGGLGAKPSQDEVLAALRKTLLARYQAYRGKGLAGIAAYDRGGGQATDPATDLRAASKAAVVLEKSVPAVYEAINNYPAKQVEGAKERFEWTLYNAHDEPTYILTHRMMIPTEGAYVVMQRQFYVSRGFNNEQAIAGFLPTEKGSLVAYTNHTSTDQVTGFGGSAKRSIGRKLMASQLENLFKAARAKVEKD